MKKMISMLTAVLVTSAPGFGACSDVPLNSMGGAMAVNSGVTGKVVETTTAGDYTYINLEKDGKKAWVACPPMANVKLGQQLGFTGCTPMMDFESKALKRTFDLIMFCGAPLSEAQTDLLSKKSTGSSGQVPESKEQIVVEAAKGADAHTIADIYDKIDELDKQTVSVSGKVMKVTPRIMGRNWLHIQDGSGSAMQKNNDLVVTTNALPNVGDVVTISGTLAKDKDFGSGYKYRAILELGSVKSK
ncbi:OB-fold nucleic acid binding domain-containing protein [Citrifermentans bremense]|uniref:OB-fold nucleic acid binding domain-containing protein n=1 Tax=Citrifermentans bremense TaxID=60035 RepID=UPI00041D0F35|nr:OB-fold nucleic acid binding domain-containing protein [Citrifermentans bremense]